MNIRVFKIGGQIVDSPTDLNRFLSLFAQIEGPKLLVHGGGKIASKLLTEMGIEPKMHNGRRLTNKATLKVVVMAYAGLINKTLVSSLQALMINAIGLTGADGNIIEAHKRLASNVDYGFAGDIDIINSKLLEDLMANNSVPVLAPITHDRKGQLLNTNADTIANKVASELAVKHNVSLYYIFDKKGVLLDIDDENSFLSTIKISEIDKLIEKGTIVSGMIPKIYNSREAIDQNVSKIVLTNIAGLEDVLDGKNSGTTIKK